MARKRVIKSDQGKVVKPGRSPSHGRTRNGMPYDPETALTVVENATSDMLMRELKRRKIELDLALMSTDEIVIELSHRFEEFVLTGVATSAGPDDGPGPRLPRLVLQGHPSILMRLMVGAQAQILS